LCDQIGTAAVRSITETRKYQRVKLSPRPAEATGGHRVTASLPLGAMPTGHEAVTARTAAASPG